MWPALVALWCFLLAKISHATDSLSNSTAAVPLCKAHPGRSDWPLQNEWTALRQAVGGRLIDPPPLAAACYRNHPAYNAAQCTRIKENWSSSDFHSHHPTSSLWTNVNGYSCEILNTNRQCTKAGFPVHVLNATNAQQIATLVTWANQKNVRVSVKSTGHDFLGRYNATASSS